MRGCSVFLDMFDEIQVVPDIAWVEDKNPCSFEEHKRKVSGFQSSYQKCNSQNDSSTKNCLFLLDSSDNDFWG